LMTVLLVTAPPMAAQFFGATIGQFSSVSQVAGGGGAQANASGQPGQAGYQPAASTNTSVQGGSGGYGSTQPQVGSNVPASSRSSAQPPADEIRAASIPPPPKSLKVAGEA